jgi:hypothetical protein
MKADYLKMFRAVVLNCWNRELEAARVLTDRLDARVRVLEQRIRDYHHAFVVEKSIDSEGYNEMLAGTRSELAVAKIELNEAHIEESDVEGVLSFAEQVVGNAAALWLGPLPSIGSPFSAHCSQVVWLGTVTSLEPR